MGCPGFLPLDGHSSYPLGSVRNVRSQVAKGLYRLLISQLIGRRHYTTVSTMPVMAETTSAAKVMIMPIMRKISGSFACETP